MDDVPPRQPLPDEALEQLFPGDSEMARRMRDVDWARTSLGAPAAWPEGLKAPLQMMLTSRFEMWLGWGPNLLFFYNDAYVPTLGVKHPAALAAPFRDVWREVYADVEDQVRGVMEEGRATWNKALPLFLERSGYPEETYHTFSYSPLRADGAIQGLMCVVTEETEAVVSERRLRLLRTLADRLASATGADAVQERALAALATDGEDLPFSLLFHRAPGGGWRGQASTHEAEHLLDQPWPLDEAKTGGLCVPVPPDARPPRGPWPAPPVQALILPAPSSSEGAAARLLVLGLNRYRPDDAGFRPWADLLAGQIGAAFDQAEALDSERRRADLTWANARDLLVVIGEDGVFRAVSPSWTKTLGHPSDQVVGRSFLDFLHPDDRQTRAAALAQAQTPLGPHPTVFENRYLTSAGEPRWISWHIAWDGPLIYATGRDVTDEREQARALHAAEEALRQAQKMEAIGQLTGGVAHDFNNLLTGISGSLELLQARAAQGRVDGMQRYLDAAQGAARRAAALTQRLLAFSRRQTLDPKPTDLNRLVAGMEELIRRTVGIGVELEFVQAGGLWATLIDAPQLDNALLNLCINARDAMPDGGRLTIETANKWLDERSARERDVTPGQYVSLCVTDTGAGMTAEVAARAFDPFFTTKPLGLGTGLGLSMIYGFVRQSGGQVRIYSEPGHGTTVCLYLPRHDGGVAADPQPPTAPQPGGPAQAKTVMVVDDEPTVRMLVAEVLERQGHRCIEVVDGPSALKALRSGEPIDLLITDVGLPGGLNGRQVADAARQLQAGLKVLFITGYAENAAVGNGHLEQGMELLTKPFALDELGAKVSGMLKDR